VKKEKVIVSNLTKSYGDLLVLDNISFSVDDGEFLVIVGPTGCGKTTFLNSMTKIIDINSGSITLDGVDVDPSKHHLAYILQEYSALPWLNVEQNIAYGLKIKGYDVELIVPVSDDFIISEVDEYDYSVHRIKSKFRGKSILNRMLKYIDTSIKMFMIVFSSLS